MSSGAEVAETRAETVVSSAMSIQSVWSMAGRSKLMSERSDCGRTFSQVPLTVVGSTTGTWKLFAVTMIESSDWTVSNRGS